ncbi:MAG TPA: alpha/beta fold hydrolase [Opitutaceae bacterium]
MYVVLVHGFLDSARIMSPLARHLEAEGHACFAPTLKPRDARDGIAVLAQRLKQAIDETIPHEADFAVIGYSMGALITRYYLLELGGAARTTAFFSIAGPHHGTILAHFYPGLGARDMRPGSVLLQQLERSAGRTRIPTVCYWTPFDTMILPLTSARLPGAEPVRVLWTLHPLMTFSRQIKRDIARRLARMS